MLVWRAQSFSRQNHMTNFLLVKKKLSSWLTFDLWDYISSLLSMVHFRMRSVECICWITGQTAMVYTKRSVLFHILLVLLCKSFSIALPIRPWWSLSKMASLCLVEVNIPGPEHPDFKPGYSHRLKRSGWSLMRWLLRIVGTASVYYVDELQKESSAEYHVRWNAWGALWPGKWSRKGYFRAECCLIIVATQRSNFTLHSNMWRDVLVIFSAQRGFKNFWKRQRTLFGRTNLESCGLRGCRTILSTCVVKGRTRAWIIRCFQVMIWDQCCNSCRNPERTAFAVIHPAALCSVDKALNGTIAALIKCRMRIILKTRKGKQDVSSSPGKWWEVRHSAGQQGCGDLYWGLNASEGVHTLM